MAFFDKDSKPVGYITYSNYGWISHVVMNEHGVVFSCSPKKMLGEKAYIYATKEEAEAFKCSHYDKVAKVIMISKAEAGDGGY